MAATLEQRDKWQFEKEWATHSVEQTKNASAIDSWHSCLYRSRMHVYLDKTILVIRVLPDQQPQVLDTLRVCDVGLSFVDGITLSLRDAIGNKVRVGGVPVRIAGHDIFVWVPSFNEVRYAPAYFDRPNTTRVLRLALNFCQLERPEPPRSGRTYLVELAAARKLWPQLADRHF